MLTTIHQLGSLTLTRWQHDQELKTHPLRDLFWECALACNANCQHCGSRAGGPKRTDELTTSEIKATFTQIAHDLNARKIFLSPYYPSSPYHRYHRWP